MTDSANVPGPNRRDLLLALLASSVVAGARGEEAGRGLRPEHLPGVPLDALRTLGDAYLAKRGGLPETVLEEELEARVGPLKDDGPTLRRRIVAAVERDFAVGDTVELGGWIVAGTTARLGALVALGLPAGR